MSTEALKVRKPRFAGPGWRGPVGLAVSVALHAGLAAILVTFVASSEPDLAGRGNVPINVIAKRNRATELSAGRTADATLPGTTGLMRPGPLRTTIKRVPATDLATAGTQALPLPPDPAPGAESGTALDGGAHEAGDGSAESDDGALAAGGGDIGSASATGASGKGGGGIGGDAEGIQQPDANTMYALQVRRALERRGAYPGTARRLGLEGLVEMLVRIDGAGVVFDKRILTSSGFPQLDDAALASADRLHDLPPPPAGRPVDILVPVRFSMRRN